MASYRVIKNDQNSYIIQKKTGIIFKSWKNLNRFGDVAAEDNIFWEVMKYRYKAEAITKMEEFYNGKPKKSIKQDEIVAWIGNRE